MNEENNERQPQSDGPPFANIPSYQGLPPVRPTNAPPPMGQPGPFLPPVGGPPPYPNGYGANMPPQRPGPGQQGGPQYQPYPPNVPPQMGLYPPQGGPNYQAFPQPPMYMPPVQAVRMPKCMNCGAVTPWIVEPIFTTIHIVITVVLLLFFGFGLLYLLIIALVRNSPDNRAKICPHCGAKNMWTFAY